MKELTTDQTAWLAGIYEGEGSCGIRGGSSPRVELTMTDEDIVTRVYELTGLGNVKKLPRRGNYKQTWHWGCGGVHAVTFLKTILPWLGERRTVRANEAIYAWEHNRKMTRRGDSHCINGHKLTDENTYPSGTAKCCRACRNEATKRYREKKKNLGPTP